MSDEERSEIEIGGVPLSNLTDDQLRQTEAECARILFKRQKARMTSLPELVRPYGKEQEK